MKFLSRWYIFMDGGSLKKNEPQLTINIVITFIITIYIYYIYMHLIAWIFGEMTLKLRATGARERNKTPLICFLFNYIFLLQYFIIHIELTHTHTISLWMTNAMHLDANRNDYLIIAMSAQLIVIEVFTFSIAFSL